MDIKIDSWTTSNLKNIIFTPNYYNLLFPVIPLDKALDINLDFI